jgi:hypothetical protein
VTGDEAAAADNSEIGCGCPARWRIAARSPASEPLALSMRAMNSSGERRANGARASHNSCRFSLSSGSGAAVAEGPVNIDAFASRTVDLEQLARVHKQHQQGR